MKVATATCAIMIALLVTAGLASADPSTGDVRRGLLTNYQKVADGAATLTVDVNGTSETWQIDANTALPPFEIVPPNPISPTAVPPNPIKCAKLASKWNMVLGSNKPATKIRKKQLRLLRKMAKHSCVVRGDFPITVSTSGATTQLRPSVDGP